MRAKPAISDAYGALGGQCCRENPKRRAAPAISGAEGALRWTVCAKRTTVRPEVASVSAGADRSAGGASFGGQGRLRRPRCTRSVLGRLDWRNLLG